MRVKQSTRDGKVIIPGLINAHSHIAMTLFRGFVEDLVLGKWLERVWKYELTALNADSVRAGAKLAFAEMIRSGVTCAHDMYWHYMATIDLAEEVGFRLISGTPFTAIGDPDFDEMTAPPVSFSRSSKTITLSYRSSRPTAPTRPHRR